MTLNKLFFIALFIASPLFAEVKAIHAPGQTYAISEIDALTEIEEKAKTADVKGFVEKKPRSSWSAFNGFPLPSANETQVRAFVPWYILEFDIKGKNGEVIYPKGFTFNPLEHIKLPGRIVIFKLSQAAKIKKYLKPGDTLIADTGDVIEASNKLGSHIYILSDKLAKRLGVSVAPSFIEQKGSQLIIKEVNVKNEN